MNVEAADGALACGEDPRVLLMKQCSPAAASACTLDLLLAGSAAPIPVEARLPLPPDLDSVIAADRDYSYVSNPNVIYVVGADGMANKLELNGTSRVRSMDASHEDYLFFTYQETPLEGPPKFFLGRWLKQKLTPAATP